MLTPTLLLTSLALTGGLPGPTQAAVLPPRAPTVGLHSAAPTGAAMPVAPVALPPALQALEQKMSELRLRSESFSVTLELAGLRLTRFFGEAGVSPDVAAITVSALGPSRSVRLVNAATYVYEPAIARFDRRRPWIKMSLQAFDHEYSAQFGAALAQLGVAGAADPFASSIAEINLGSDVRELGPSVVDGQAVTGFAMTLLSVTKPPALPTKQEAELNKLLRHLPKETNTLEVFIAADGVPVRTRTLTSLGSLKSVAISEVPAVDFPIDVEPPPAKEIIGLAQLRELQKRRHAAGKK